MTERDEGPEITGTVADAARGNWVDVLAPEWSRPYLRLSRADRPIGTWLLLLPCWWGALLAALGNGDPDGRLLWVMLGCSFGAWLMRGAGCTWNDITDREFDAAVARTRSRPIPSGQVSVTGALIWMMLQSLLAFAILLTFDPLAIWLGVGSLALVAIYPFAKRFTWWPQIFLGLAFNWGALLAYAAVSGRVTIEAALLYACGIVWTLFYDTIYAHQDKEDDALIGVKSTARLFGDATHRWLRWFMFISVALMAVALIQTVLPLNNPLKLAIVVGAPWGFGWHLAWQNRVLKVDDPDTCLRLFRANRNAGLIPVLFLAAALLA